MFQILCSADRALWILLQLNFSTSADPELESSHPGPGIVTDAHDENGRRCTREGGDAADKGVPGKAAMRPTGEDIEQDHRTDQTGGIEDSGDAWPEGNPRCGFGGIVWS